MSGELRTEDHAVAALHVGATPYAVAGSYTTLLDATWFRTGSPISPASDTTASRNDLDAGAADLNSRPRKTLGWRTLAKPSKIIYDGRIAGVATTG
jgi:hypothetical protein